VPSVAAVAVVALACQDGPDIPAAEAVDSAEGVEMLVASVLGTDRILVVVDLAVEEDGDTAEDGSLLAH